MDSYFVCFSPLFQKDFVFFNSPIETTIGWSVLLIRFPFALSLQLMISPSLLGA
jgi:hypothetical protein